MATKWTITGPLANTLDGISGASSRATAFVSGMSTNMTAKLKRNSVEVLSATIPGPLTASTAVATLALTTAPAATITTTDVDDGADYVFELISGDGNSKASAPAGPTVSSTIPIEISEDLDSASTVNVGPLNFDFDVDLVVATPDDYDSGTVSGTSTSITLPAVATEGIAIITLVFASTTSETPPPATITGWTTAFDRFLSTPVSGTARSARHIQFYREGAAAEGAVTVNYGSAVLGAYTYYAFQDGRYERSFSQEGTTYTATPSSPAGTTSYDDVVKLVHMTTNQFRRTGATSNAVVTTAVDSQDAPSIAGAYTTQALAGTVSAFSWTLTDPVGGNGSEQTQSSLTLIHPFGASPSTGGGGSGSFTAGSPPADGAGSWSTIHVAGDTPIQLPWAFYGWHRYASTYPSFSLPNYGYALDRNWDFNVSGGADCSWARCNPSSGVYNWTGPDRWIADTEARVGYEKKFRIFTISLTPEWAVAPSDRIYNAGSGVRYPTFPNASFPPQNQSSLATFTQAIINRYGSNIDAIEVCNEPTTPSNTNRAARNYGASAFYNGSWNELAVMTRTIRQTVLNSAHPNIQVWGCAFEDAGINAGSASKFRGWAQASDGAGGYGIDHVDVVTYHPYMYNYDPVQVWNEAQAYYSQLSAVASALSRPNVANLPLNADETGHENPSGIQGGYGAANWSGTNEATIVKDLKQAVGYALAAAKYNCRGIVLYQDRTDGQTFRAPINNSSALTAAAEYAHTANGPQGGAGKIIRQISVRTGATGNNPATWIRFDDNTEYLA